MSAAAGSATACYVAAVPRLDMVADWLCMFVDLREVVVAIARCWSNIVVLNLSANFGRVAAAL